MLDRTVRILGLAEIPGGFEFDRTAVGGPSGTVFDPEAGTYLTVSDDHALALVYDTAVNLNDGDVPISLVERGRGTIPATSATAGRGALIRH